jgi:hypothetical protein
MKFRAYNSGKITDYEVLVRIVSEVLQRYICKEKKLVYAVLSALNEQLSQNNSIYRDNFYDSSQLARTLLGKRT